MGDNPAYSQFETTVTQAQKSLYNDIYLTSTTQFSDNLFSEYKNVIDTYSDSRFGNTTLISNIASEIKDIESSIFEKQLKDLLTQKYDRIDDTNNTDDINELNKLLDSKKQSLRDLAQEYSQNEKEYRTENRPDNKESDNWTVEYKWIKDPSYDAGLRFGGAGSYDGLSYAKVLSGLLDGSINDWMAGGSLYDSPRAGGAFFNVTGDLNTVRFLGLEDKNYNEHLDVMLNGMGDVQRLLQVNAGSDSFSVL
jgi:hypothetical protein